MRNINQLKEKGYVILSDIYTLEDIKSLRSILSNHFKEHGISIQEGKAQPNALLHVPELKTYIFNDKIIKSLRELLGDEQLMFTFHSDIHKSLKSGWHKDDGTSRGTGYFGEYTYDFEDCQVIKLGVYLQNHYNNRGGLVVRPGSHRKKELTFGKDEYVPTRVGDVVAFDVRLNHTGQIEPTPHPFLNKMIRKLHINPKKAKWLSDKLFGERYALFFTYGRNNHFTTAFSKGNMERQELQTGGQISISTDLDRVLQEKELLSPFKDLLESYENTQNNS